MNKEYLLETAKELKSVSQSAADEYQMKSNELIQRINDVMLKRADISKLVGDENLDMMKDNHSNHVRFMASIIKSYNAEVMTDTVLWVFNAYQNHGFASNYWASQLNSWMTIMKSIFTPETYKEVLPFYEWMQVNIPVFVKVSEEVSNTPNNLHH